MDGEIEPFIRRLPARGPARRPAGVIARADHAGRRCRADANELIRRRHEKLDALRARGVDPFGGALPGHALGGHAPARFKDADEAELAERRRGEPWPAG